MSNIGVHDFAIPHDMVSPTRDMVIIRMPMPPKMVGSLHVPDVVRDMAQHNVMAGRIVGMGALAFAEKHEDGVKRVRVFINREKTEWRDPQMDDWAVIRPFAGTMLQGGKLAMNSGWRYVSSFQDVIGVIAPAFMPPISSLIWDDVDVHAPPLQDAPVFDFDNKKETARG